MSHNDSPLKDVLLQWMHGEKVQDKLLKVRIEEIWDAQWGRAFNRHMKDLRFKSGVLYIHLHSAVLRHELNLQKQILRLKLNESLGEEAIKEIRIR